MEAFDEHAYFTPGEPVFVARAPGRLDVMGGIADYSGSLVLQLPLGEATVAAVQHRSDRDLVIRSQGRDDFRMALPSMAYNEARAFFDGHWAAYVAGAFIVLAHEKGFTFNEGATLLISSSVPEGKGVSSSAALEVAVMKAVCSAFLIDLEWSELARLCQKVENLVAGAPCGIMDQMTAAFGEADRLLRLKCQPATIEGHVEIPDDVAFFGIDSGIRHHVSGEDYASVRTGAFMGYRIIADVAGLDNDPLYRGYLANIPPWVFEEQYAPELPERMKGSDFLAKYQGTTDPVTRVDPDRDYAVRTSAAHPVHEHFRVRAFAELMNERSPENLLRMGELMYQSHASYSACGLGSDGTDRLVDLVREAGPAQGLFGAKITGGGSGGTVAVLGHSDALPAVREIARRYAGHDPYIFTRSSPAARTFGSLIVENVP